MRTEQEMKQLILDVAVKDERVRAVTLGGSRTNPNAPKDRFQDFDVCYFVTELESFIRDPHWIDVFGERMIMQTPEAMAMFPPDLGGRFSYLMLFTDGNRIDLTLAPLDKVAELGQEDRLNVVWLDKDGILPELPPPTDEAFWVKRPSADYYADCCNEFWWVSTYVAKGLWRRELLYALDHLNRYMRPMLMCMLEWQVGARTDFSVSTGKSGKYMEKYLQADEWQALLSTYAEGTYDGVWDALFAMTRLFRRTAKEVAERLGFVYPEEDDRRVTAYLQSVRELPRN